MDRHMTNISSTTYGKAMDGTINVESLSKIEALKHATQVVNLVMKEAFTLDANYSRYIKLRERFETFSYLISCPERFPLAKAYEYFGEPNFNALRAIFQGCKPSTSKNENRAGPSGSRENTVVIDVDEIVDLSSGSEEI
ncbi:hypothetical protein Salat_2102100 [Sesamum alatum]|uniref:Uncharacterized protein n=1 Tax=Sesamum alatum TaxID=300844 RepID=A0AAE1Y0M9_9LAMI|nr:hypothetical protein Salat_2102100 [Sesamum alatum]